MELVVIQEVIERLGGISCQKYVKSHDVWKVIVHVQYRVRDQLAEVITISI